MFFTLAYVKDPDNKDFWIIDEEAAEVVRLIFRLFIGGKNRNQIAVHLTQEQIPTPTFYMKDRGRGTCKNKTLNEDNRCKWNKATLTNILTRQEYCGDVVNFKTTKHFRDKHNHYVDRSQWHITENVHEPIISRSDFETVQRILENAPVRRPNGDGEIHPLSGLLFCKDCGAKMHIRIDYRNGGKRHVSGRGKNAKEISDVLGKETIDSYNQSENRGAQTSHGLNYQKLGKELMSQDEIATMDGGKCILQVRGVRPFFSEKYDITRHPRYKYLSDADKKNYFDVDSYLSSLRRKRRRVITEDEPFDLYDIELSEEDFSAE